MKVFYIDCEFNGFLGRLISMALVSGDLTSEFYEVLDPNTYYNASSNILLDPWVEKNVIPHLNKSPISVSEFQRKLSEFLIHNSHDNKIKIVADWPEDITHFTKMLINSPGQRIDIPKQVELVIDTTIDFTTSSKIPHNALEDARAIAIGMSYRSRYYDG